VNCSEVQHHLSAYHDSELSPELTAEISAHLADCSWCAAELASFSKLSDMSRGLSDPRVPTQVWDEIEARLHGGREVATSLARFVPRHAPGRIAIAATILFAVGVGVIGYQAWWSAENHVHIAVNFAAFLDQFDERPEEAQQFLMAKYEGRLIKLQEAASVLGYEPIAAQGLPEGCVLERAYLLKMPCCACTEVVCRNKSGRSIAIFEHDSDQPVWFGDRPTVNCLCHEIPTSVVLVGDKLAATWKNGQRYITIIGANDLVEVTDFVAYFNKTVDLNG
jgi:hypothetical protein